MPPTNSGRDLSLGTWRTTIDFIGLAGETGTELSGGSPAYARQGVTWTAVGGSGVVDNTGALVFDIGGSTATPVTVARVLVRADASGGTDYGWSPVGGTNPFIATVDASNDAFTNFSHGLVTGNRVYLDGSAGAGLPTGVSSGTLYHVVNAGTNTFQVATSANGTAVNITASGECWVQQCIPETYNSQGTYTIAIGDLDLYALLF